MKYLIAKRVIYDSESGELMVNEPGSEQSMRLTDTANRILSLLVASPGKVLERDYLLDKVWEEVGHPGSNSSLSQYISILRKTLNSLIFSEEIIIAVPKVGFYFSHEIAVDILSTDDDENPVSRISPSVTTPNLKDKKILLLITINAVLLLASVWMISHPKAAPRFATAYPISNIDHCNLTAFVDFSDEVDPQVLNILRQVQPQLEKKCSQQPAKIMVHFQPSVLYGSRGRFFYAFCPKDKSTQKIIYCENHYFFNWELK